MVYILAKVFPGDLTYTKVKYEPEMADKKSSQFKTTAEAIVKAVSILEWTFQHLQPLHVTHAYNQP